MAEVKITPSAPFVKGPPALPKDREGPSFGETFSANWSKVFSPIIEQNKFFTNSEVYDPESQERVDNYIDSNDLSRNEEQHLKMFGIGSPERFAQSVEYITKQRINNDILNRSSGGALMFSDPSIALSFFVPVAGVQFSKLVGKALYSSGNKGGLKQIARANALMSGRQLTRKEITKISALDGAVTGGTINLTDALTELGLDTDNASSAVLSATLSTMADGLISGAFGYGLSTAFVRPKAGVNRAKVWSTQYKAYLNSVNDKPKLRKKPGDEISPISYGGKWFNESWAGKMIPSPIKTTVTDKSIPDLYKVKILSLGGANGIPLVANQMGQSMGNSVYINAGRRQGEWYAAMDVVNDNYRKVSPRGKAELFNIPVGQYVETVRAKLGKESFAPAEWQDHLGRLIMDDVPYDQMTPEEAASTQAVRAYFEKFGGELEEIGLINKRDAFEDTYLKQVGKAFELTSVTNNIIDANKKWMTKAQDKIQKRYDKDLKLQKSLERQQIARGLTNKQVELKNKVDDNIAFLKKDLQKFQDKFDKINNAKDIDELASLYNELDLTDKMRDALQNLGKSFDDIRFKIDNTLELIEHHSKTTKTNKYDLPRIFNRQKIHKERDGFRNLLIAAYKKNPTIVSKDDKGLFQIQKMATDPASLHRRAEETIQTIMEETDEDAIDAIFTGFGRSGPLVSRRLNVPNSDIKEYLVTDVKELMINYGARVAPKLEYHKANLNPDTGKLMSLEEDLFRMRSELNALKVPRKSIDKFLKNYVHTYDRVVGTTLKRADSIDTKIADMLRTATSWTFLGGSGVAAFGDAASIFMDHELNIIGRSLLGLMDDISLKHSAHELKLSGEALEMTLGTTHLRYMESLSNDLFQKTLPDKLNNAFFVANGLGPVTVGIKMLDGLVRGHTIIDSSIKLTKGNASDFEKEFLARYNITEEMAERISSMPHQKSTGGELILPNTEAWTDVEAVNEFRNALRSGVMNRVIMGGPEDKPITMDGVAYIPDHVAKTLPYYDKMPRDPRVKGYVRVESGFLALPFTFYSFVVGALNKITGKMAAGAVRNKTVHIAVAMMLGYSVSKFRTPEWAWDKMDTEDKIMRSFDMSGIAALQSDLLYRAITMAHELGADDKFPIQPKYSGGYDPLGSFVSLGGAPADWTLETMRSIKQMVEGDVGEGAKSFVNMIPLIETMATGDVLKDTMKDIVGQLPNRP